MITHSIVSCGIINHAAKLIIGMVWSILSLILSEIDYSIIH